MLKRAVGRGDKSIPFTTRNHYVPQWYQERFLAPGRAEDKYYYLDLHPEKVVRSDGGHHFRNDVRRLGPISCFKEDHLYTLRFGKYAFGTKLLC